MVNSDQQAPLLLAGHDCDDIIAYDHPDYQILCYTRRSIAKETINEDALLVMPASDGSLVLGIADGLGGQRDGALASQILVETLQTNIKLARKNSESTRSVVLNAIEQANRTIMALGSGAGTTLALVDLHLSTARSVHIGDSEILLTGQRGKLKFKTISHSPVGYMVEAGLIDSNAALQHKDRHIISNCVGIGDMHIDIGPVISLARYDTLIMASDGVFDNLAQEEIIETIRKGSLAQAAQQLLEICLTSMRDTSPEHFGKPDDLSFILVRRR